MCPCLDKGYRIATSEHSANFTYPHSGSTFESPAQVQEMLKKFGYREKSIQECFSFVLFGGYGGYFIFITYKSCIIKVRNLIITSPLRRISYSKACWQRLCWKASKLNVKHNRGKKANTNENFDNFSQVTPSDTPRYRSIQCWDKNEKTVLFPLALLL